MEIPEGLERHVQSNPFKYSEDQLKEREKFVEENTIAHPKLPELWSQWLYDWIANKTDEEREQMMCEHKKKTSH